MSLFRDLERQLADLQKPRTLHDLHNLAGREVYALVQRGFDSESDPYGRGWKPSQAAQKEKRKTLRKTGALQDGIKWKADSRGVTISTSGRANRYAGYLQRGTRYMDARPFLPDGELPPAYEKALTNVFRDYFREKYGAK